MTLDDATASKPSFKAPDVTNEALTFELVVTSASGTSAPDSVSVFVTPEDDGGCNSSRGGSGSGQALVMLLPLAALWRRRRR